MRDLLTEPACRAQDLGLPLPDDPHAVSVAMPLWEHVVGYEEGDPVIVQQLKCGYPRFLIHPIVRKLFEAAEGELAGPGERVIVCPSQAAADRCAIYITRKSGAPARVQPWRGELWAVITVPAGWDPAVKYWRFCGEIVSSRRAEAALRDRHEPTPGSADAAATVRERLAGLSGQGAENVFLFPSGIASVFALHRAAGHVHPGRPTVQLEFPYVDVLKVQEEFGAGVRFLPNPTAGGLPDVAAAGTIGAVFCEAPSNPQLRTVDLPGLSKLLQPLGIPLFVDDTVATIYNIDPFPYADAVSTSLTKSFSGVGNVLAGSVILRRDSPLRDRLAAFLQREGEILWGDDAIVLERNSRDFSERMPRVNRNAEAVVDFLNGHPKVERVWYPKLETPEIYRGIQRPDRGFGGLFSLLLKDAERTAEPFYNALRVSKGPSLGTNFTLACPYMLLAHYPELDWAEGLGMSRYLLRFSVGLEEPEELIQRLETALVSAKS